MNPYMQFMSPCPFPYQGNQMQYQSFSHPSNETIPPQFRGYPEGCHPFYHPPWGSSGMYPSQNYGCCNHNFFPPYFPPFMPHSHHPTHCCGGYSVPPGAHPCNFPPLHSTMGPTQFEFQKDNPTHQHCFDCPNNTLKGGNTLRIEDSQTDPKGDISVVSSDFKNSPYPIVLGPPNYIQDNRSRKENESSCDRKEVSPDCNEKLKPVEPHPLFLNGWLPVDINKWRPPEQVEDSGKKIHNENERPYLPLPFFYVPYKADDTRMMEQNDVGQQCSQRVSPIPIHVDSSKNKSNEKVVICEDPRTMEKKNEDDFPTEKKGEETEGKKIAQITDAHVGNEAKKTSVYGKRKSSSPPKSSKLPPVCLRVDPLPKKKKGCSLEKPSSPRDEKDKSCDSFKEDAKSKASPSPNGAEFSQDDILVRDKLEEQATSEDQPHRKIKTIKVYDAESQPGEGEDLGAQSNGLSESTHVLSEDEAVKIIQSGYRGYKERKWEPLKKLKDIKAVQEKVTELKKQIESLGCTHDNTLLDKSRTIIGETIMNLLLKLDSIQGLPPDVRLVRKSVARDLMSLQDQLDALGQRHDDEKSITSALFVNSEEEVQTPDYVCIHGGEEKDRLSHGMGSEIEDNKNHEEPPLIELSVGEENEAHKEDVRNVADRYTNQLNDLLQNGFEPSRNEFPQDVSSNTVNLESESLLQSVDNDQVSGIDQPGKEDFEAARLIEELNCVPNTGPAEPQEQVLLESEENKYREPEQTSNSSKMTNLIEMDDGNKPEHDTFDLSKASVNAEPVSEDSVTKQVQVSEVCEGVQEFFSSMSNKNADDPVPEPVAESTNQVHKGFVDSTEESGRVQEQNESIVDLRCEEPEQELDIAVDEDHDIPADLTALPQEQKQIDESLEKQASELATEMFTHPCERTESERAITERSLIEENERLREQLKKLIETGQEQLSAISSLSGKLKDLERKLNRKKKVKLYRSRGGSRSSCLKMSMDDDVRFAVAN